MCEWVGGGNTKKGHQIDCQSQYESRFDVSHVFILMTRAEGRNENQNPVKIL